MKTRRRLQVGMEVLLVCLTAMLLALFWAPNLARAASEGNVSPEVERALLAENWSQVADLLKAVNPKTASPVLRLLKGHACLALNRNNEALCLFLSIASDGERQEWLQWSDAFAHKHPQKPVAHYFRGDAQARLGRLLEAETNFTQGLHLKPDHPLLLNGKGVVLALQKKWSEARINLTKAGSNPKMPLADAYVNLGEMFIYRKDGARGAVRAFDEALKISPEYCLAFLGRGCVKMVLSQNSEAEEDFKQAQTLAGCAKPLVTDTILAYFEHINGLTKADMLAISQGNKAGTVLDARFRKAINCYDKWKSDPGNQKLFNRFHTITATLPSYYQDTIVTMMKDDVSKNQHLAAYMKRCETKIYSHNSNPVTQLIGKYVKDGANTMGTAFVGIGAVKTSAGVAPIGVPMIAAGIGIKKGGEVWGKAIDNTTKANLNFSNKVFNEVLKFDNKCRPPSVPGGPGGPGGLPKIPHAIDTGKGPGGVEISFQEAAWDAGDWPFKAYFGLLYQTSKSGGPPMQGSKSVLPGDRPMLGPPEG